MNKQLTCACLWLMIFCLIPAGSQAVFYQPGETVYVRSEISGDIENPNKKNTILWMISSQKNHDGSITLSYVMDGQTQPICQVRIAGSASGIQWEAGPKGPDLMLGDEILIAVGFPAPCDVLPLARLMADKTPLSYEIRRTAGSRTRVDEVQVDIQAIGLEEAVKNKWVSRDFTSDAPLWLVRALNKKTNAVLVQQVWSESGIWWLYEETLNRRSWQVR